MAGCLSTFRGPRGSSSDVPNIVRNNSSEPASPWPHTADHFAIWLTYLFLISHLKKTKKQMRFEQFMKSLKSSALLSDTIPSYYREMLTKCRGKVLIVKPVSSFDKIVSEEIAKACFEQIVENQKHIHHLSSPGNVMFLNSILMTHN